MAREGNLWTWLSRYSSDDFDGTRVENSIDEGTPDVELCFRGVQAWVELKSCRRPKRPTTPVRPKVRDAQVDWLMRRWEAGGLAWILVQVGERYKAKRYLLSARYAYDLQLGITEGTLSRCAALCEGAPVDYLRRMIRR